jgi:group I intron endonuclease
MVHRADEIEHFPHHCYLITNLVNGKVYVGVTYDTIENRFNGHCRASNLKSNTKKQPINFAIAKHGRTNFKIELLATYSCGSQAYNMEPIYIKEYRSDEREFGYNIAPGGHRGPLRFGYSKQEIEKILHLFIENISVQDIALIMNKSLSSIQDILRLGFSHSHNISTKLIEQVQEIKAQSNKKHRINQTVILNIFNDYAFGDFTLDQLGNKYNYKVANLHSMLTRRTHQQFSIPEELVKIVIEKLYKRVIEVNQVPFVFEIFLNTQSMKKTAEIIGTNYTVISNILRRRTHIYIPIDPLIEEQVQKLLLTRPFAKRKQNKND